MDFKQIIPYLIKYKAPIIILFTLIFVNYLFPLMFDLMGLKRSTYLSYILFMNFIALMMIILNSKVYLDLV